MTYDCLKGFLARLAITGSVLSALLAGALPAVCQTGGQSAGANAAPKLTVEAIYGGESLTGVKPDGLAWRPDGKVLSYLDGGDLVGLETSTGKRSVIVSREKLAALSQDSGTEQDKDHRTRYGMASYLWAPDSKHILFDADGRLWFFDLKTGTGVETAFSGAASGDTPAFSPDGQSIAFVRDHGLAVVRPHDVGDNVAPVTIAAAPSAMAMNGEVDWVYAEELEVRQNFFWSPDSSRIAYLQTNEDKVPEYPLTDWIPTHASAEMQRYPQPGDPNPEVRVGVVSAHGGHTTWIKLPAENASGSSYEYVPRFGWVDKHTVWIETLSRDQKRRAVYFADASGNHDAVRVLEVKDDKFLDDNYDVWVGGGAIVLSGWIGDANQAAHNHVWLYSYDAANPLSGAAAAPKQAAAPTQLTSGAWDVDSVLAVDAARKLVFYSSNESAVLDRQIWQVSFSGERKQLTTSAGVHEGEISPDGAAFADTYSSQMAPPKMQLCATGGECREFWASKSVDSYGIHAPELIETKLKDGTILYSTLTLPEGAHAAASVPVILNPYGGSTGQTVRNEWGDTVWGPKILFDTLLAQHGFAVLRTDNRGTPGRGREFEQACYRDFGKVQLEDQLTVLDAALASHPELDPKRLGWWGWSWGGTFTLYAMTHSDRFKAGVSVAPVTDWHDYDSVYTERYMGLPEENAAVYKADSTVEAAANLKGRLLLVHGTGDDNVHIENSVQFVDRLVNAGIPYDLQIFPRKTHEILGSAARVELFSRILAHFKEYLQP